MTSEVQYLHILEAYFVFFSEVGGIRLDQASAPGDKVLIILLRRRKQIQGRGRKSVRREMSMRTVNLLSILIPPSSTFRE